MRFLVAWDGSELGTLALRAAIHILSRKGDQLLVYHVTDPEHRQAAELDKVGEEEGGGGTMEALEARVDAELQAAEGKLHILTEGREGRLEEVPQASPSAASSAGSRHVLTVHETEAAKAARTSQRIVDFALACGADALVMGSVGGNQSESNCFRRTTLGSSAHMAAQRAPCTVMLIRPGCKVDKRLATVFMVAVDGSQHALHALRLSADMARPEQDEIVCRVFGPADFTAEVQEVCETILQEAMREKKVEYAVIPTELEESADVQGNELEETARQCRFRQQAFLVFGARGKKADGKGGFNSVSPDSSPTAPGASTSLGHVARWCIAEAQCSLIIARPSLRPTPEFLLREDS